MQKIEQIQKFLFKIPLNDSSFTPKFLTKCSQTWETVKEAESYLLCEWRISSEQWIKNVSEPYVFTVHVLVLCKGKTNSSDTAPLLLQPTTLAGATIPSKLVTSLLHAAFRQSVLSQILFSITLHFVALYCNQQCTFSCGVAFSTGTCIIITL